LAVNAEKKTVCVLWDAPIAGQQVTSELLGDTKSLGVKASGKQLDFSQKVATIIKEGEQLAEMDSYSHNYGIVKEEVSKKVMENEQKVEAAKQKGLDEVIRAVINANINDFRRIEQIAVDTITVGAHNYQIDELAGIIRGYQDYVFNRVADTMKSLNVSGATELQVPVTTGIMKIMADNMLNSYFMTRDGYIREEKDKWAVYNKRHVLLGKFGDKRKALSQIRSRDYRLRKGLEE